jgi:hypothetical protein
MPPSPHELGALSTLSNASVAGHKVGRAVLGYAKRAKPSSCDRLGTLLEANVSSGMTG